MSTKDDPILYGAKRAGVTWLFKFSTRSEFNELKAGAKRFGMSLAEFLCRQYARLTGAPELPKEPRKFTEADSETATLEVQIRQCDEFTRACLERQAKSEGCDSVEEYITHAVFHMLETDEKDAIIDARTEKVVLNRWMLPDLEGCKIDQDARPIENNSPLRITALKQIPAGTIVEQCA